MYEAVKYPIYADNGKMFCMCSNDGKNVKLEGPGGKVIDLMKLEMEAMNPQAAMKNRGKKQYSQKK